MIHDGYLYVLSNPAMPGILKIGVTERSGAHRARELYSGATGVPSPFRLEFEVTVRNALLRERHVHDALEIYRFNSSREFFRVDLFTAVDAILRETFRCFSILGQSTEPEADQEPELSAEEIERMEREEAEKRERSRAVGRAHLAKLRLELAGVPQGEAA